MHDWIEASSVVFTDEEGPQEVYQRLLHTVTESFGKWLSDGGN